MTLTRAGRTTAVITALGLFSLAVACGPSPVGWGSSGRRSALRAMHIPWPSQGESAITVLGAGWRASHPRDTPVPIASVAKVMTGYVVLRKFPLAQGQPGFRFTLGQADAEQAATDAAQGQSYVPIASGEALSERQALEALLLPSANNIALALAERVAGSLPAFVALMNEQAVRLGMSETTYTDPSGLAVTTTSTALDQLRLARVAFADPVLSEILGMRRAEIPVAGTVHTTDALLGHDGIVAGKTGSDAAAGGCFMFKAVRVVGGRHVTVIGVVLGQRDGPLIPAGLYAADKLLNDVLGRVRLNASTVSR